MTDASVRAIIDILENKHLVDDNYTTLVNDLFKYKEKHAIDEERVELIVKDLPDFSQVAKITCPSDLVFLTMNPKELNDYLNGFKDMIENYNSKFKLRQLGCFRAKAEDVFKRVKYCIENGVPYVDSNGVLLNEVNFESESHLYLDGYYIKDMPGNDLSNEELELYQKVCGLIQTEVYNSTSQPLSILGTLKENIISTVKDNPTLTIEEIESIVIDKVPFLKSLVGEPKLPSVGSTDITYAFRNRNGSIM